LARKILLADDSVTAQNMGRKILTDAGYEVITVNNGSAALKKIIEHKPDLIVLDVYMPGYSGLEVCQRIKENRESARIPILLTVGKLEPFKPEEARRARADAFVVKPFEASELLAALSKLEDKIIPQPEPYKQGRFAKAVASFERDTETVADPDEGWKARLRIPSAKPKPRDNEPDPDYTSTQGKGFRDLVEPPAKRKEVPAPPSEAALERPMPAGLPHDITPEEIAAITAAAAQLTGGAPAAVAVPPSEKVAEQESEKAAESGAEASQPAVEAAEPATEEVAPVTFASAPELASAEPSASQIPGQDETVSEAGGPQAAEAATMVSATAEPQAALPREIAGVPSETAVPEMSEPADVSDSTPVAEIASTSAPAVESAEAIVSESSEKISVPTTEAVPATDTLAPWPGGPAAQQTPAASEPVPAAADDEVMAALQTLIPSNAGSAVEPAISLAPNEATSNSFAAVTAVADQELTRAHAPGPRWIAEEVALAHDETAISLEKEMASAYAAVTAEAAPVASVAITPEMVASVSEAIPAPQNPEPVYAMASAAAAGEAMAGSPAAASQVPAQESAIIDGAVRPEEVPIVQPEELNVTAQPEVAFDVIAGNEVQTETTGSENETAEGTEIMAANWKNIRDSIAGATAPAPAKEEFKEQGAAKAEPEAPAAAASEKTNSPSPAADPQAIASIVDSVLAELRPRIVEEIARKLADTKKD
jgi:CheY-like chemotaxis protein